MPSSPPRPGAGVHAGRDPIDDWQRLSALYEEADALDEAALQARLAQWQREGLPLLDQLRAMLAARAQIQRSDFLGTPPALLPTDEATLAAAETLAAQGRGWGAGSTIGSYRLLRHIGAGGMAEVWLAERADGAFKRQVAIKLLFRHADSTRRASFAQRFARERDILASLHHPNIAALHDAGVTGDGQPWLALEYVEGEPITHWCDRQRLPIAERVRLFRQVLLAVQHAHANLVIHRDIKPANILVAVGGEVRLLDFGIAKMQEVEGAELAETELTRHAGRPLTVQYASPEQLSGLPLTTACDVYSLGVVFYELLCGERPYELKTVSAGRLEEAILEAEPRAMSRRALSDEVTAARGTSSKVLRQTFAPELDAVVLRMLAKQPSARYGSIESVIADIDRWRRGVPVLARVPSTMYRFRKFAARHPVGVGLGAAASVSLIVVALVAVALGLHAREEAQRSKAATQFLFDMFRNADPDNSQGIGPAAGLLLDKGRQKVLQTMGAQPDLQAELLRRIAEVQLSRGDYKRADQTIGDVVRLDAKLGLRRDEARALVFRALIGIYMGDSTRAAANLAQAAYRYPRPSGDIAFEAEFARVQGLLHRAAGELPQARQLLEAALGKANEAFGQADARTAAILNDLSIAEAQARAFEPAMEHIDREIALLRNDPNSSATDVVNARDRQAAVAQQAGRYRDALSYLQSLTTDCERWLDKDGEYCSLVRQREAVVLLSLGRPLEATALLPMLERRAGNDASPIQQAEALLTACRVAVLGRLSRSSSEDCNRVRALAESGDDVRQPAPMKFVASLVAAEVLVHDAKIDNALTLLATAESRFALNDKSVPRRFVARLHLLRGVALAARGQNAEAVRILRTALDEHREAVGIDHPTTVLVGVHLALCLRSLGQVDEALVLIDRAIPIVRDAMGPDGPIFIKLIGWRDALKHPAEHNFRAVDLTDLLV
jgi:tetratricopeptide (TPR) repeat protein/tRNA A-37 threonylcarbamoyl transferase component Bud32